MTNLTESQARALRAESTPVQPAEVEEAITAFKQGYALRRRVVAALIAQREAGERVAREALEVLASVVKLADRDGGDDLQALADRAQSTHDELAAEFGIETTDPRMTHEDDDLI